MPGELQLQYYYINAMGKKTGLFYCLAIIALIVLTFFVCKLAYDISNLQQDIDYLKSQPPNSPYLACSKLCPQYLYVKANYCCKNSDLTACQQKSVCYTGHLRAQQNDINGMHTNMVTFIIIDVILFVVFIVKVRYDRCMRQARRFEENCARNRALMAALLSGRQNPINAQASYQQEQVQESSLITQSFVAQDKTQSCAVCWDTFEEEKVVSLNCLHLFHRRCIQDWLNKGDRSCPICRAPQSQVMGQYHIYGQE